MENTDKKIKTETDKLNQNKPRQKEADRYKQGHSKTIQDPQDRDRQDTPRELRQIETD